MVSYNISTSLRTNKKRERNTFIAYVQRNSYFILSDQIYIIHTYTTIIIVFKTFETNTHKLVIYTRSFHHAFTNKQNVKQDVFKIIKIKNLSHLLQKMMLFYDVAYDRSKWNTILLCVCGLSYENYPYVTNDKWWCMYLYMH